METLEILMVLKFFYSRSKMIDDPLNDNYRYHAYRGLFCLVLALDLKIGEKEQAELASYKDILSF